MPDDDAKVAALWADPEDAPSLVELVDHLLDQGCVITGEVILGIADVDLVYCELSVLLCSVERLAGGRRAE